MTQETRPQKRNRLEREASPQRCQASAQNHSHGVSRAGESGAFLTGTQIHSGPGPPGDAPLPGQEPTSLQGCQDPGIQVQLVQLHVFAGDGFPGWGRGRTGWETARKVGGLHWAAGPHDPGPHPGGHGASCHTQDKERRPLGCGLTGAEFTSSHIQGPAAQAA